MLLPSFLETTLAAFFDSTLDSLLQALFKPLGNTPLKRLFARGLDRGQKVGLADARRLGHCRARIDITDIAIRTGLTGIRQSASNSRRLALADVVFFADRLPILRAMPRSGKSPLELITLSNIAQPLRVSSGALQGVVVRLGLRYIIGQLANVAQPVIQLKAQRLNRRLTGYPFDRQQFELRRERGRARPGVLRRVGMTRDVFRWQLVIGELQNLNPLTEQQIGLPLLIKWSTCRNVRGSELKHAGLFS